MIKYFIERPIFATVIAILVLVGGLVTIKSLPIAQYPSITPPTIQVTAVYPGADAQTVAQTVAVPIEQQVNGVEGMIYMSSTSASDGSYNLTITFEVGTDIDMAAILVQNRVNAAQGMLPEAVLQQGITTQKRSTNIVMFITLTSTNPIYNSLYLSNYAQINLVDRLSRLEGVGSVQVFGMGDYSMRIWMDPEVMRIRGITPADVYAAVTAQNKEISAGGIGLPPVANDVGFQFSLSVPGRLTTVDEFGNIVLRSNADGSFLRLKDVARIDIGAESYGVTSNENGEPAAAIAIYQLPGANALDVAEAVRAELQQIDKYIPDDVNCKVILDTTEFVNASIDEILKTFLETLVLVILVILLFLQSFRAMIIPVVVIPISIIGTFAFMHLLGFSINTLTLFGLVLAIAIVVDDAIVVVENAVRYYTFEIDTGRMRRDKNYREEINAKRREAVKTAMDEIIGPVVGIVLVLLAVFVPTGFIGGISGQLYRQFAITIAVATLLSGVISILFTPAMCAIMLTHSKSTNKIFLWFERGYAALENWYVKAITWLLRYTKWVMAGFAALTLFTVYLYMKVPTSFIPEEDEGYLMVSVQLPPAASLQRTIDATSKLEEQILGLPQVKTCMVINGSSVMGAGRQSNSATLFVMLKNWNERKGKGDSSFDVVNKINAIGAEYEQARIFAISPSPIPGLGNSGGLQFELEDINSYGYGELQDAVNTLIASYREFVPSAGEEGIIARMQSEYQAATPQYLLNIDRDKVDLMGLNISDVFNTISFYLGSAYVNDFVEFGRIFQVKLQADAPAREFADDILRLTVKNPNGEMVPLSTFATLVERVGVNNVTRYNMYNSASVTSVVSPAFSSSQGTEAIEELVKDKLGDNYDMQWTGVAYQEQQAGSSVITVLLLSLLIVVLVLAAQYESVINPLVVLMGVPFALLGAIVGSLVMGLPVSIYSQIGIVLLIALSAKNAILIVEFAMEYRAKGESVTEAAIEAGKVRLRPILMTSIAFILGVVPLMLASGAGAQSRVYLGTVVVFGMLFNTVFGTLFIPNFYHFMNSLKGFK